MAYLDPADLEPFAEIDEAKAFAMIEDAVAQAVLVAPCLAAPDDLAEHHRAAVKAVLRGAVLRWNDSGSGALTQQTAGPFSVTYDNRQSRRTLFWPSEIEQLQAICSQVTGASSGAFAIDTAPTAGANHAETCSLVFGALYCSCGADIAGGPLWG